MIISQSEIDSFLHSDQACPHDLLGMRVAEVAGQTGVLVRAYARQARTCEVIDLEARTRTTYPMQCLAPEGLFETFIPERKKLFRYRLRVEAHNLEVRQYFDPYSFPPTLSADELYLFNEGNFYKVYDRLGAHQMVMDGIPGVAFAVWAPNARRVSVVGNFNGWDGRFHPMRALGNSGVWELFIPGLAEGEFYKFEIKCANGALKTKTDPYGQYFEGPPNNASIVYEQKRYAWSDMDWQQNKRESAGQIDQPISIYEVHLGSWQRIPEDNNRFLSYRELAPVLASYVKELGFTHVELLPVAEHPFEGSWGYQVTGFFAPTHRFGTPDDFKFLVDHLHQEGIGVILDWVPAHFPRDSFALEHFDGTHLYEHEDPRLGAHQDWGTLIFNYGRNEVRLFLVANALYWLEHFHIDGLRVDAVASMLYLDYSRKDGQWLPNRYGGRENLEAIDFLRCTSDRVRHLFPGTLLIAEESTAWPGVTQPTHLGGLGFDLKWNMGWMHDTLRFFSKDPIHRKWHLNDLTFGMLYQYAENFISVFSHDEVTHGKGSMLMKMAAWDISSKAQTLRALYAYKWAYPGKKLLFMGSEFGQSAEWNHNQSLDWHLRQYMDHEGIRILVRDLNTLYRSNEVLSQMDFDPENFRWVACWDADSSVVAFARHNADWTHVILTIGHFTPVGRSHYRMGLPKAGRWKEILNTDSTFYGGQDRGNGGEVISEPLPADGFPDSATFVLPPLTTQIFEWRAG